MAGIVSDSRDSMAICYQMKSQKMSQIIYKYDIDYIVSFTYLHQWQVPFFTFVSQRKLGLQTTTPTSSLLPAKLLHRVLSFYSVPHVRKRGDFYGYMIATTSDQGGYRCRYLSSLGRGKCLAGCLNRVSPNVTTTGYRVHRPKLSAIAQTFGGHDGFTRRLTEMKFMTSVAIIGC